LPPEPPVAMPELLTMAQWEPVTRPLAIVITLASLATCPVAFFAFPNSVLPALSLIAHRCVFLVHLMTLWKAQPRRWVEALAECQGSREGYREVWSTSTGISIAGSVTHIVLATLTSVFVLWPAVRFIHVGWVVLSIVCQAVAALSWTGDALGARFAAEESVAINLVRKQTEFVCNTVRPDCDVVALHRHVLELATLYERTCLLAVASLQVLLMFLTDLGFGVSVLVVADRTNPFFIVLVCLSVLWLFFFRFDTASCLAQLERLPVLVARTLRGEAQTTILNALGRGQVGWHVGNTQLSTGMVTLLRIVLVPAIGILVRELSGRY
jgi:hypothetical protein